ncbi:MAG: hydroxymethylglutaryl-CoA lyase, partial [Pseudomonadota bacterium]
MVDSVEIVEVSPRDGIQNEKTVLSTRQKLDLIDRLAAAGLKRAEVTSFVNPKRVPQMADADEVAKAAASRKDFVPVGLVLNRRGYDRALATGLPELNFVVVATDTFNHRNQGSPTADTIAAFREVAGVRPRPVRLGVVVAAAFGCPFEGEVSLDRLKWVIDQVAEVEPDELSLADTIGVATPKDIAERVGAVRLAHPRFKLRLHLHNTRGTGIANAWAGLEAGVSALDASFGGVGGCPFAPRATGNIATEDLVYLLDRSGVHTGVDLD